MSEIVIGIDLGTTNSCAAYYYDGILKIFENASGGRTTPSVVCYNKENLPLVGEHAKKMGLMNPEFGVFEIKKLMGRQKNDPYVQDNLKYLPFKIDEDDDDDEELAIMFEEKVTVRKTNPSTVSASILKELKQNVESKLGHKITKAVITVPAYFNVSQREATLKAAKKAGFQVLKLLNEPTAAALSYYHYKKSNKLKDSKEHYSLVFDLGGGTFDVAIIKKCDKNIKNICVDGDTDLGGHDFEKKLFDFVCQELAKHHNFEIRNDRRLTRRILSLCEDAKKELSNPNVGETLITFSTIDKKIYEAEIPLTKKLFEEMIIPYIQKTIQIVDNCIKTAKLSKEDISEIIVAGGSTRVLKVQEMLTEYFNKPLNKYVSPDECVAEGAAIQAALLSKDTHQKIEYMQIYEVTPSSLGISDFCNQMSVIIPRNTIIPASKSVPFVNSFDQQTTIAFNIYEGERLNARKNRYLTTLTIDNLTPAPPEQCDVILDMSIDNNGILKVTAQEKCKNNTRDLKTTHVKTANEKSIKQEIQSNEEYEKEDKKFKDFILKKTYLLDYCIKFCYEMKQKNLMNKHKDLYTMCENILNEVTRLDVEDEKRVGELMKDIKKCDTIAAKYNFKSMPTSPAQMLNKTQNNSNVPTTTHSYQYNPPRTITKEHQEKLQKQWIRSEK